MDIQGGLLGGVPFVTPERGSTAAPVTIIEFSDFQCPFCSRVNQTLNEVFQSYPDKVRLLFKQAPLPIHSKSNLVHETVLAAHAQRKFWQMHDLASATRLDFGWILTFSVADIIGERGVVAINAGRA